MTQRFALAAMAAAALAASPAAATSKSWTIALIGKTEVPGPGSAKGEDSAVITVDDSANSVCYAIRVAGIGAATMAHVHTAPAGAAGPVAAPLGTPGADGTTKGCTQVSHDVAAAILANPAGYYVNIHTAEFPAGAVRGQLPAG